MSLAHLPVSLLSSSNNSTPQPVIDVNATPDLVAHFTSHLPTYPPTQLSRKPSLRTRYLHPATPDEHPTFSPLQLLRFDLRMSRTSNSPQHGWVLERQQLPRPSSHPTSPSSLSSRSSFVLPRRPGRCYAPTFTSSHSKG